MKKKVHIRLVRVFLASPSDVCLERERAKLVVDELNRSTAVHLGLRLECLNWEEYVAPLMGRPQQVVLNQLSIEESDVFIGILWHRFGTPSGMTNPITQEEFYSGTEEEFTIAYHFWKKNAFPEILFYRCTRPPVDLSELDATQLGKVTSFIKDFSHTGSHPGLVRMYQTPEEFERRLREDLSFVLRRLAPKGIQQNETELNVQLNEQGFMHLFLPSANEERDDSKIITLHKAFNIRLIAHSGFSFLALVGHRFRHIVEERLAAGARMRIILASPWSETGFFIALAEHDNKIEKFDSIIRQILHKGNFGQINPVEIIKQSNWYSIKLRDSMQGYKRLKAEFGEFIEVRYWLYEMPMTILLTEFDCYVEPYLNVDLQERLKREMLTYEFHLDTKAHLYCHSERYFEFLWKFSVTEGKFMQIEMALQERLNKIIFEP